MKVFINDSVVEDDRPLISASERGFLLGDGVFDTLKYTRGKLIFLNEHYQRLMDSAEYLGLPFKYSIEELRRICEIILIENCLTDQTCAIRITLTRGISKRGVDISSPCNPTFLVTAFPYQNSSDHSPSACITTIIRNEYSPLVKFKTLNYLELILNRKEARAKGFEEGIMLNTHGAVLETSIANIFLVMGEKIYTPKITDGILPGIMRSAVIASCKSANLPIFETTLFPKDFAKCSEVFQTNSLLEIQSLRQIGEYKFLAGSEAKITAAVNWACQSTI